MIGQSLKARDEDGSTAMHWAAYNGADLALYYLNGFETPTDL